MHKRRAVIWCDVTCDMCSRVIGTDYVNAKTIAWKKDQGLGNRHRRQDWYYDAVSGLYCKD